MLLHLLLCHSPGGSQVAASAACLKAAGNHNGRGAEKLNDCICSVAAMFLNKSKSLNEGVTCTDANIDVGACLRVCNASNIEPGKLKLHR
jgi:hypothetical protein